MMLRYLLRATGNDRALAEDLTADVFVRAMQSYQHGNQAAIETAYLMTSARNRLIDHLRRRETEERKLALAHASDDSSTPLNADAHSFLNGLESRLTAQWEAARSDTTSERPQERASERSSERTNETQSFRSGS